MDRPLLRVAGGRSSPEGALPCRPSAPRARVLRVNPAGCLVETWGRGDPGSCRRDQGFRRPGSRTAVPADVARASVRLGGASLALQAAGMDGPPVSVVPPQLCCPAPQISVRRGLPNGIIPPAVQCVARKDAPASGGHAHPDVLMQVKPVHSIPSGMGRAVEPWAPAEGAQTRAAATAEMTNLWIPITTHPLGLPVELGLHGSCPSILRPTRSRSPCAGTRRWVHVRSRTFPFVRPARGFPRWTDCAGPATVRWRRGAANPGGAS
jgi:hypothetical protein